MTTRALVLSADLMDRSRFQGAAGGEVVVTLFRGPGPLWDAVRDLSVGEGEGDVLVLLDLARAGVVASIPVPRPSGVRLIGFGPHVDDELLAAGRAAGLDEVLPRSVFFRRLPELLGGTGPS